MTSSQPPIATVYVQNLEERIKLDALIAALTSIFSEYGTVLDVVAKSNLKAKGQAFVVFDNPESAAKAIEEIQGFELFGKPMRVALARTRSDATVQKTCSAEELELHKRHRIADKEKRIAAAEEQRRAEALQEGALKLGRGPTGLKSSNPAGPTGVADEYLPPNKILFLQNIPDQYDTDALTSVFGRFEGFKEVRLVPGRRGLAFVEYENDQNAITAKESTSGMTLGDDAKPLKVTYQRK
ncbi:U1 small nuclear ribonucleoprotein usp102 [Ceratocystis lukuohia]|uniref:U1 small nuclear ribonucleoprotein usp102 n=1 Tax=Ceratocystis lukuohia TaxID=2019550 RepID=A0ABR4MBM5_9PEZI